MSRWNDCEEKLPSNGKEVHHTVHGINVLNLTILALGWVKHASSNELRCPCLFFLLIKLLNQLSVCICFLLLFEVSHNVDDLERFLAKFGTIWSNIRQLEAECIITVLLVLLISWFQDFDFYNFLSLLMLEF